MTPSPRIRRRAIAAGGDWPDSVPPLLRRIYEARGALSMEQAQPRLAQLLPEVAGLFQRAPGTAGLVMPLPEFGRLLAAPQLLRQGRRAGQTCFAGRMGEQPGERLRALAGGAGQFDIQRVVQFARQISAANAHIFHGNAELARFFIHLAANFTHDPCAVRRQHRKQGLIAQNATQGRGHDGIKPGANARFGRAHRLEEAQRIGDAIVAGGAQFLDRGPHAPQG